MLNSEEYEKCVESPAYFFNNYIRILDRSTGTWVKPNPITDEQIENAVKTYRSNTRNSTNRYEIEAEALQFLKEFYGDTEIMIISQKNINKQCQQD